MPSVKFLMARVNGLTLLLCLSCTATPSTPADVPAIPTAGSAAIPTNGETDESRNEIFFERLFLSDPWNEDILAPRNGAATSSAPAPIQGLALNELRVSLAKRDDAAFRESQQRPHVSAAEAAWILDADKPLDRLERALLVRRQRFPLLAQRIEEGGSKVHVQFMGHGVRGMGYMGQSLPFPPNPMAPTFSAKNIAELALLFSFPRNGNLTNELEVTLDGCETGRSGFFGRMRSAAEKVSLLLPTAKVRGYLSSTVSDKDGNSVTEISSPPVLASKEFDLRRPFPSRPHFAATVEFRRGECVYGIDSAAVGAIENREVELARMRANTTILDATYLRALDAHDSAMAKLLLEMPKKTLPPAPGASPFSVDTYQTLGSGPYGTAERVGIGRMSFGSAATVVGPSPRSPAVSRGGTIDSGEGEAPAEIEAVHKLKVPRGAGGK